MRKCVAVIIILLAFGSCKNKKVSLQSGGQVELNDFINAFPEKELPYVANDTSFSLTDTTTISYDVFTRFVPDSIFTHDFENQKKVTIQPVARFNNKQKETYLVTHVSAKKKSALYFVMLDEKLKFSTSLPLLYFNNEKDVVTTVTVDKKFGITIHDTWKANETEYYRRNTYAYNNVGTFTLVLSETNDFSQKPLKELNPIDTFPRLNKFSGDYYKGKTNFISLRDGKDPQSYLFYVHFTNNDEEQCSGELKGALMLTGASTAVYTENGPCVIDFTLTGNQVKVKEQGSCGNYRGIKCFFDDTYTKKKEPKKDKKKSS